MLSFHDGRMDKVIPMYRLFFNNTTQNVCYKYQFAIFFKLELRVLEHYIPEG